jgi:hypothetical protein
MPRVRLMLAPCMLTVCTAAAAMCIVDATCSTKHCADFVPSPYRTHRTRDTRQQTAAMAEALRVPSPQATIFGIFQKQEVSVDVVATSEVSISLTLDPSKIWSRDLIDDELDSLVSSFGEVAKVCNSAARLRISLTYSHVDMMLVHGLQVPPATVSCGKIEGRLVPGCMTPQAQEVSCSRHLTSGLWGCGGRLKSTGSLCPAGVLHARHEHHQPHLQRAAHVGDSGARVQGAGRAGRQREDDEPGALVAACPPHSHCNSLQWEMMCAGSNCQARASV